ncbi:MAG: hypothetical protein FOGNACKC_00289 [Anaerolineae bacterium]|nr:hypothetical protein [Anaerolineae bacterium]
MVSLLRQPLAHWPDWPNVLAQQAKNVLAGFSWSESATGALPLATLPLFADLSEAEQQLVFGQMRLEKFDHGETLFVGDAESTAMYLLKTGRVNLFTADQSEVADTCHPGDLLGQTELLLKQPYSQTARAADKVTAWVLDEPQLTSLVTSYPNIGLQLGLALGRGIAQFQTYLANQISKTALLAGLSAVQRRILARYLTPYRCMPQEIIYRVGDPPTGIFVVDRGTVLLINETDQEFTELTTGDTFGEQSVIYGVPHAFSAQAMTEVVLWLLSPADFAALAGVSPSITATLSHNLFTSLTEALQIAVHVIDSEIDALSLVAGRQHSLVRKLYRVRQSLAWVKNNQIGI